MRYDLHMHTYHSKCSNLKPKTILKLAKKNKLDGIAITDHHEIKGAIEVKNLNKNKDFEVMFYPQMRHGLLNDTTADAHAAHQTPVVAMHFAVFLAGVEAQEHLTSPATIPLRRHP